MSRAPFWGERQRRGQQRRAWMAECRREPLCEGVVVVVVVVVVLAVLLDCVQHRLLQHDAWTPCLGESQTTSYRLAGGTRRDHAAPADGSVQPRLAVRDMLQGSCNCSFGPRRERVFCCS
jgi:hypothetical protein